MTILLELCWMILALITGAINLFFLPTGYMIWRAIIDKGIYSNKLFTKVNLPTIHGVGARRIENGRKC